MPQYGPIQVLPPGFLNLLQLKNTGQNPETFDSNVIPTFEMLDWYLRANALDYIKFAGVVPGVALTTGQVGERTFSPNAIFTPNREWWWVQEYTVVTSTLAAGDISDYQPCWISTRQGTQSTYCVGERVRVAGTAGGTRGCVRASGFWIPPDCNLGFFVLENIAAVTTTYTAYLRFLPLQL